MASRIADALARLDPRVIVRRGTPANEADVARLSKATGCRFPADYVRFLKEFGALHVGTLDPQTLYEDMFVPGHAPADGDLDVVQASELVVEEFDRWSQQPSKVAVFQRWRDHLSECSVFDGTGKPCSFHRGRLEASDKFEQVILESLDSLEKELARRDVRTAVERSVLERILEKLPPALVRVPALGAPGDRGPLHRIVLGRDDGVDIELRFGDGREYSGETPGLFVFWSEPGDVTEEAMNAWNREAWLVRGSAEPGRARYRGLVVAEGLDPEALLAALAHDAKLPVTSAPPAVPSLEAIEAAIARHTTGLLPAFKGIARDGETLTATIGTIGAAMRHPITIRGASGGFVRVDYRVPMAGSRDEALTLANVTNRDGTFISDGDHDVNFDMEKTIRATLDDADVTLTLVSTLAGLSNEAIRSELSQFAHVIGSDAIYAGAPRDFDYPAVVDALEGRRLGPKFRALLDLGAPERGYRLQRVLSLEHWIRSEGLPFPPKRAPTPWGSVLFFGTVLEGAFKTSIAIGLATERGTTSDDSPVVGWDPVAKRARLLAPDIAAFVSVLVYGTSGFGFEGDEDEVRRNYRERCITGDLGPHFFQIGEDLLAALGVAHAPNLADVLARAGAPAEAEVDGG